VLHTSFRFFLPPLVQLQVPRAPAQVPGQGLLLRVGLLQVGLRPAVLLRVGLPLPVVLLLLGPRALPLLRHFRWRLLLQYKWQSACEFLLEVRQLQVER